MGFINLDLHKIVVATRLPGLEMLSKGKTPFQGATIHLRFDVWLIRLACPERSLGAGFERSD